MKNQKKLTKIAKDMLPKSLKGGYVNPQKVRQTLKEVIAQKPAGLISILKIYKRLIEKQLSTQEVTVETATPVTNRQKLENTLLKKTSALKVHFKVNPTIVFGAKIIHGDWIYDATLDTKLGKLLNG